MIIVKLFNNYNPTLEDNEADIEEEEEDDDDDNEMIMGSVTIFIY